MSSALQRPGTRVLLVGTGTHQPREHASVPLPDIPAVEATVHDLRQAFVEVCGVDEARIHVILDPADPLTFGRLLADVSADADDLLLVYYVGHGLVGQNGELYLATAATDDISEGLDFTALPYSAVRNVLLRRKTDSVVVVLDCCFSGRADGSLGTTVADAFGSAHIRRTYLLASAAHDESALALPGERHTAFSGALLRLLTDGDDQGPPFLTLGFVYDWLNRSIPPPVPRPHRQAGGQIDGLVLGPNLAYRAVSPPPPPPPSGDAVCPYRGLEPFADQDTEYFFGREPDTRKVLVELTARMSDPRPLALVGPSGSGKSSLLHAGVLPGIRAGELRIPGSHSWPRVVLAPGEDPLSALASALAVLVGRPAEEIRAALAIDPNSLGDLLRQAFSGVRGDARLVLVVDQFEELFTACTNQHARAAFIRALEEISTPWSDGAEPLALVVLGVRSDFYAHCTAYPELVAAMEHPVAVGPLGEGRLREVIEKPAAASGQVMQPGLVDLLLRDLRTGSSLDVASLPLLSYALRLTWHRRSGSTLTMEGYQATGGIWEAVARQAENIYESLGSQHGSIGQDAARVMLLRLVRIGDGTEDTRRQVDISSMGAGLPAPEAAALTAAREAFAQPSSRLISLDGDSAQITHEALLRAWPRLREWIDEDRSGLLASQRLAEAALAWERSERHDDALWRGVLLADAHAVADDPSRVLTPLDREFVGASDAAQQQDLLLARRRTRRLQRLVAALAALLVVALALAGVTFRARQQAVAENRVAVSRQMAAMSENFRATRPRESQLLAVAAWRSSHTERARSAVLSTQAQPYRSTLIGHRASVHGVAFSPVGDLVATASADSTVRLWDPRTSRQVGAPLSGAGAEFNDVTFSPDGRLLATAASDGTARLWDVRTRQQVGAEIELSPDGTDELFEDPQIWSVAFSPDGASLAVAGAGGAGVWSVEDQQPIGTVFDTGDVAATVSTIYRVTFSPDGRLLATGGRDGKVRLWDAATHQEAGDPLAGHTGSVHGVAFSPDGKRLASASSDGSTLLWNVASHRHVGKAMVSSSVDAVDDVRFSPDGRRLAVASVDKSVRFWDVRSQLPIGERLIGHTGNANAVAFSPDGSVLASVSDDGTAVLWSTNPALGDELTPVFGLAFSPRGDVLATAGAAGVVHLWDPRTRRLAGSLAGDHGAVYGLAFSPDGRLLATADEDGTVQLWDVRSRERSGEAWGGYQGAVRAVAFSPDGRKLAAGGDDSTIHLYDLQSRTAVAPLIQTNNLVIHLLFSPDGQSVGATTTETTTGSQVSFWSTKTGAQVTRPLTGHQDTIWGLRLSPDRRTIVTTSSDQTIRLWDAAKHTQIGAPIAGHSDTVFDAAFSPDGRQLVTGSLDQTIRLWTLQPHRSQSAILTAGFGWVNVVAFSPDGHTIASASGGTDRMLRVYLWDIDVDTVVRRICERIGSDLTPTEAQQYLEGTSFAKACA